MEPIRKQLNLILEKTGRNGKFQPKQRWIGQGSKELHKQWWELRFERQKEIDASIAAKAEFEYLYDKPYEDNSKYGWPVLLRLKAFHHTACWVLMKTMN
jgi:adenine-specific DNA-methyltransferase